VSDVPKREPDAFAVACSSGDGKALFISEAKVKANSPDDATQASQLGHYVKYFTDSIKPGKYERGEFVLAINDKATRDRWSEWMKGRDLPKNAQKTLDDYETTFTITIQARQRSRSPASDRAQPRSFARANPLTLHSRLRTTLRMTEPQVIRFPVAERRSC
jgi:hypothetical protein